jgi:hypothetical protein
VLAPGDLEDEDVVHVVVRAEAARPRGCDVGVALRRVAELGGEPGGEVDDGRPRAVEPLQHDRGAVREEGGDGVVADLVADLGPGARGAGERTRVDDRPVLGQAQERGAQPATGQQLVRAVQVEHVAERTRVGSATEQRCTTPVPLREVGDTEAGQAVQDRAGRGERRAQPGRRR